jgi:hypothetical protein
VADENWEKIEGSNHEEYTRDNCKIVFFPQKIQFTVFKNNFPSVLIMEESIEEEFGISIKTIRVEIFVPRIGPEKSLRDFSEEKCLDNAPDKIKNFLRYIN